MKMKSNSTQEMDKYVLLASQGPSNASSSANAPYQN